MLKYFICDSLLRLALGFRGFSVSLFASCVWTWMELCRLFIKDLLSEGNSQFFHWPDLGIQLYTQHWLMFQDSSVSVRLILSAACHLVELNSVGKVFWEKFVLTCNDPDSEMSWHSVRAINKTKGDNSLIPYWLTLNQTVQRQYILCFTTSASSISVNICHSEFGASNNFRTSWQGGNKRLSKL